MSKMLRLNDRRSVDSLYHSLFQQQNKPSQDVLQYSYDQNYLWGALIEQNLTLNVVLYFMIE
jgi:hypothetical protein